MTNDFVRDCWYVITSADEVRITPLRRPLMGDAVVLFRTSSGEAVALTDRCVHCGAPLSRGTVVADLITCPYHGLAYDASGTCVKVPSQLHVPDGVRVRTFPTHDDGRFIWIWPGNAAAADLTPPPRLPALTEPAWSHFGGTTTIEAGLLLLHEHLLDLTHFWVGLPGSSPGELSELPPLSEIEVTETTVGYRRTHPPAPLVGWEAVATSLDPSARFSHRDSATFASPALQVMTWEIDGGDDTVFEHVIVRALTPETDSRTKVTWLTGYNYADRQPHAIHTLRTVVADTIQQDASMVEMVQANLTPGAVSTPGSHRAAGTVALLADTAALTATRIVRAMIDRETGRPR